MKEVIPQSDGTVETFEINLFHVKAYKVYQLYVLYKYRNRLYSAVENVQLSSYSAELGHFLPIRLLGTL